MKKAAFTLTGVPSEAILDERVSHAQMRVLCLLCYKGAARSDRCFASYRSLGEHLGMSRRTIMEHVASLASYGYVEKIQRLRENGSVSTNILKVIYDVEIDGDETGAEKPHQCGSTLPGGAAQPYPHKQETYTGDIKKKNIKKKTPGITLAEWEKETGTNLCIEQLMGWVKENNLNPQQVRGLIGEFRDVMQANGNTYADFIAAFKNYLRRGYLSRGIEAVKNPPQAESQPRFETFDRGVTL